MHSQITSDKQESSKLNQPLLNCGSPALAVETLSTILSITPNTLLERIKTINLNGMFAEDVEQRLADEFWGSSQQPDFSVVWFHGTRLLENHTLMTEGLLPAHMVRDRLRKFLKSLGQGLEREGENPFSSASFKPSIEGPFGNLFRDDVISPRGASGNYICHPELIDDIAGSMLGENYLQLTERVAQYSKPSVVHFVGKPTDAVLSKALRYALETHIEKLDSAESARSCTTSFDGGGKPVSPQMILQIEDVSMYCS